MAATGGKMDGDTTEISLFADDLSTKAMPTFAESKRWMVTAPNSCTMQEAGEYGTAADTATRQISLMATAVRTGFSAYVSLSRACVTEYESNDTTEAANIADAYVPDFFEPVVGGGH